MENYNNCFRDETSVKNSAAELHEAILANSYPVVQLLLNSGVDPDYSPLLAPCGVALNTSEDRNRDVLLTLGRMFRGQRDGYIHPLEVAIINAYHNASSGSANAIQIIKALLEAGANINNSCHGIVLCNIGGQKYLKFRESKTALQLALLLKQLLLPKDKMQCTIIMDEIIRILISVIAKKKEEEEVYEKFLSTITTSSSSSRQENETILHALWKGLINNDETLSQKADFTFICPDGTIEAHRCILAANNSYFHSILSEKNDKSSSPFTWKTSHPVQFIKIILQYIYTRDLNNSTKEGWINDEEYLTELLQAASDFELNDSLIKECGKILSSPFYLKTSCKLAITLAKRFKMKDLFDDCIDFIRKNHVSILTSRTFIDLSLQNVELWKEISSAILLCPRESDDGNPPPKKKKRRTTPFVYC